MNLQQKTQQTSIFALLLTLGFVLGFYAGNHKSPLNESATYAHKIASKNDVAEDLPTAHFAVSKAAKTM